METYLVADICVLHTYLHSGIRLGVPKSIWRSGVIIGGKLALRNILLSSVLVLVVSGFVFVFLLLACLGMDGRVRL